jgi:hypothetical protein
MSVLGACWAQAYFGKKVYFGRRPIFGRKICFGKDHFWRERPIFGARTTGGKKEACKKRRKRNMQEEKQCGMHEDKPNHVIGLGFLTNIVMAISL